MRHAMNKQIEILPLPLLAQLGTQSRLEWLLTLPELQNIPHSVLFQSREGSLYLINAQEYGLTLALQCLNPSDSHEAQRWGFRSFTLDGAAWSGPWFGNLKFRQTHAHHLIQWLAEAEDEVMHQHPMLCFPIRGTSDQVWSVIAAFDAQQKTLDTFSLVCVGDWREAPPLAQQHATTIGELKQPMRPAGSLTCLSGAPTPETGVWEGKLPATHAQARILAQAPHRFAFKRAGDAMGVLGLPAPDEALVTWTWLQSR